MDEEIAQLERLETYRKEDLLAEQKVIKCKWVYCLKRNNSGEIVWYKACLIAKGFSQIPGINYGETFMPVMQLEILLLKRQYNMYIK